MARYGVKVSQQGVPVDRAADYQMVLDSDWKFLDIAFDVDIDIVVSRTTGPNGYYPIEIFNHGLGYIPAFEFLPSPLTVETAPVQELFNGYREAHRLIKADNQKIYANLLYTGSSVTIRLVGKLRVFALDILTEYMAPTVITTTTVPQPVSRYGAKFLDLEKGTGDINDEGMVPFTMNTRGKQISIHKHGTARTASGLLNITHNVGYPPTYLVCRLNEQTSWPGIYAYPFKTPVVSGGLTSSYYLAKTTSTTIEFRGAQAALDGYYGYIILKDPAEIAG